MARRIPPLNAVRAFESAARLRSMSRAAQELHVTHGAVSRQVRQLEDWLGTPVFQRGGQHLQLTAAGQTLLSGASQALDALAGACEQITRSAQLTLACPGSFLMRWLIPRLDGARAALPGLDLRLAATDHLPDFSQGVDAAIVFGTPPWPAGLDALPLGGGRFGPVCHPRLAERLATPADALAVPRLHTASRREAWAEWAGRVGLGVEGLDEGQVFDHLPYMLEAAAAGLGVALAPELLVRRDLAVGRLVAPLGFIESAGLYTWLTPAANSRRGPIVALRDWLAGSMAEDTH